MFLTVYFAKYKFAVFSFILFSKKNILAYTNDCPPFPMKIKVKMITSPNWTKDNAKYQQSYDEYGKKN